LTASSYTTNPNLFYQHCSFSC